LTLPTAALANLLAFGLNSICVVGGHVVNKPHPRKVAFKSSLTSPISNPRESSLKIRVARRPTYPSLLLSR
jgi:hypothetical protein